MPWNVHIPSHLNPGDFNWRKSRPKKPWVAWRFEGLATLWHFVWMELFRTDVEDVLKLGAGIKKAKRGRPAEYNWDGVKTQLTVYVSENGPMQTLNELLQKCADFASELHPNKSMPDDKTIREAIKTHRLDIAARLSGKIGA
jgi:hypothetical protein